MGDQEQIKVDPELYAGDCGTRSTPILRTPMRERIWAWSTSRKVSTLKLPRN